ncbi:MAG: family N-acetyltransferase [Microvirga sp.]|jgi:ribosomal-protein-alanine N-acetyltransferase|nr:family N-acetyltransferase [Microvirga sp.]
MRLSDWLFHRDAAIRIGRLATSHAARLAEIHAEAFTRPWDAMEFERSLTERNIYADGLFLDRSAEPAGFILSRRAIDEAEILSVALAPEARGRGHSGALLDRHLQSLAQAGVRSVFLEVEEGNRPALALYRRRGFREIGRRQGYYARPDGTRASAITMRRQI